MTVKVSIIMPCFNGATHLPKSVGSVLKQSSSSWELVIIDDGSTDNTWKTIEKFSEQDTRIRGFRQQNAGQIKARNQGLRASRGQYIAFLDADDTWDPLFLETMENALDQDPEVGIAYCGWQNIGLPPKQCEPFIPPDYENANKVEALLSGCRWPIHGVLIRRNIVMDAGCFDETLSTSEDFDLWLRIGTQHKLTRVPKVLAFYHHHGSGQITGDRAEIALNHWRAQKNFLRMNPSIANQLGTQKIKQLTLGYLLHKGFATYWIRDLSTARKLFRVVMMHAYGSRKDWKYMLPSWLPLKWHQLLLRWNDK